MKKMISIRNLILPLLASGFIGFPNLVEAIGPQITEATPAEILAATGEFAVQTKAAIQSPIVRRTELQIAVRSLELLRDSMQSVRWIKDEKSVAVGKVGAGGLAVVALPGAVAGAAFSAFMASSYVAHVLQLPIKDAGETASGGRVYRILNRGYSDKRDLVFRKARRERWLYYVWRPTTELPKMNILLKAVAVPANISANIFYRSLVLAPLKLLPATASGYFALVVGGAGYTMVLDERGYYEFVENLQNDIDEMSAEIQSIEAQAPSR